MIYREYLVMRKALAWFVGSLVIMLIVLVLSQHIYGALDYAAIAAASGWLSAILASSVGIALGDGSREPAHVLWLVPKARWKLAVQVIAVDLAGTTVAFACVYLVCVVYMTFAGIHLGSEAIGTVSAADVAMALALAYATYGWSALAGMLGRRVAHLGIIALPGLTIWMILAQSPIPSIASILRGPIIANPFVVFNTGLALRQGRSSLDPVASSLQWLGTAWETPVLVLIAIATCGGAAALWHRAQPIQ